MSLRSVYEGVSQDTRSEILSLHTKILEAYQSAGDEASPDAFSMLELSNRAMEKARVEPLRFLVWHLESGSSLPLGSGQAFYCALSDSGVVAPESFLTEDNLAAYRKLEPLIDGLSMRSPESDHTGVHVAAVLSGEADEKLVESVISELLPQSGEEFLALLGEAKGIHSSVLLGVL